nr:hypothetical protein BgiMline_014933 [Biomphalaria glabrata]
MDDNNEVKDEKNDEDESDVKDDDTYEENGDDDEGDDDNKENEEVRWPLVLASVLMVKALHIRSGHRSNVKDKSPTLAFVDMGTL